jgi:antitoxin (DNA-binding transcriptional repressor) of toxin-antitoxin stability system
MKVEYGDAVVSPERRMIEYMAVIRISEADLARDVHGVLERVQNGAEVVIEQDNHPVAVMKPPHPVRRTLSELILLAEQREKERGYPITLDADFAADVEEIVRARKPWTPRSWD